MGTRRIPKEKAPTENRRGFGRYEQESAADLLLLGSIELLPETIQLLVRGGAGLLSLDRSLRLLLGAHLGLGGLGGLLGLTLGVGKAGSDDVTRISSSSSSSKFTPQMTLASGAASLAMRLDATSTSSRPTSGETVMLIRMP